MADERSLFRVVHRVGHVAHEDDVFADGDHLADTDRAAEHAHVEVYAHEDDVVDAVLREQVVRLLPVVGDGVTLGVDLDEVDLPRPRLADRVLLFAVATHVGVVDREVRLAGLVWPAPVGAPADVLRE